MTKRINVHNKQGRYERLVYHGDLDEVARSLSEKFDESIGLDEFEWNGSGFDLNLSSRKKQRR
ncbi:hypothetical protein [Methanocella sp. MCL-LM]|uniref:hypothetical protein n=1 Tax=Methanocella sp. MCL-LM TaxID=3412035 RepID=UPI003C778A66